MKLDETIQRTFARNLKALRCSKMLTCEALNMQLEFKPKRIVDFEYGRVKPTIEEIIQITEHFSVNIDFMLYRDSSLNVEWK